MYNDSQLNKWISTETAGIVGICEATRFEKFSLWRYYHHDQHKMDWKTGTGGGPMITIGMVNDRPVVLCLCVDIIDNKRVLFIDATSQLVDWLLVEKYVEKTWPGVFVTDANNFTNIFRTE